MTDGTKRQISTANDRVEHVPHHRLPPV